MYHLHFSSQLLPYCIITVDIQLSWNLGHKRCLGAKMSKAYGYITKDLRIILLRLKKTRCLHIPLAKFIRYDIIAGFDYPTLLVVKLYSPLRTVSQYHIVVKLGKNLEAPSVFCFSTIAHIVLIRNIWILQCIISLIRRWLPPVKLPVKRTQITDYSLIYGKKCI